MPIAIPAEILPVLSSLGITNPANSPWKRAEEWPGRYLRAHVYCQCASPNLRVELTHTWLANRRIFIGQCPHCQKIWWRDATSEGRR